MPCGRSVVFNAVIPTVIPKKKANGDLLARVEVDGVLVALASKLWGAGHPSDSPYYQNDLMSF
jgi:hypothetical protein